MSETLASRISKLSRLAETVVCPQCGAEKEQYCISQGGWIKAPHAARVREFDRLQAEKKKKKSKRFEAEQFNLPLRENTGDAKWAVTKRADVPPWA